MHHSLHITISCHFSSSLLRSSILLSQMASTNPLYLGKMPRNHVTYRLLHDESEPTCPFCLEVVENLDVVAYGPCGHGFHSHCAESWNYAHEKDDAQKGHKTALNCPLCRGPFPFVLKFNQGKPHPRPEWEPDDTTAESEWERFLEFNRAMEELYGDGFEGNPISALIRQHLGNSLPGDDVSTFPFM